MSHSLYDRLLPFAARRVVALLMVLFLVLFLVVFPAVISRLDTLAGKIGMIDTQFSYTPAQVFEMVAAYGPEGRALYVLSTLTADLLFPFNYSLLLALLMILTYRQAFANPTWVRRLIFIPFLTAGMDLLENAGIVALLLSFPQQWVWLAQAAGLFTTLKWIFMGVSYTLVLVGFVGLARARLRGTV